MRRGLLTFIFLLAFAGAVHPALPDRPQGWVADRAGLLDGSTKLKIESLLTELEKKTSAEVAIVTVASLDGQDIDGAAVELFEKWGIGKKGKDNGILLLVAADDRKVRIEVGYGLEGVVTDARSNQILYQGVLPAFKNGRMAEGVLIGAAMIAGLIADDAGVELSGAIRRSVPSRPEQRKASLFEKLIRLLIIILLIPIFIRHPWLLLFFLGGGRSRGGYGGGGFGGGFGGFGGGLSGGGGASGGW